MYNEDDFSTRIAPYLNDLRAYCNQLTRSGWETDDLIQETLTRLYRAYTTNPNRPLTKTYLKQIAKHVWIDQWRTQQPHAETYEDDLQSPAVREPDNTPSYQLNIREAFELLAERLSARQMVLILLQDVFAFTARETAELLHATEGAVKEGIKRARKRLHTLAEKSLQESHTKQRTHASTNSSTETEPVTCDQLEIFLHAFRQGKPQAICASYLALTAKGVHVAQVKRMANRYYFLFRDPDGHLLGIFSEVSS